MRNLRNDRRAITGLAEARLLIVCACFVGFFVFLVTMAPTQLIDVAQLNQAGLVVQPTYASQSGIVFVSTFNTTLGDVGSQNIAGIKLGSWIFGITAFGPSNGGATKGNIFLVQSNAYAFGFINYQQYQTGTTWIFQGRTRCNPLLTNFPAIGNISCALNNTMLNSDAASLGLGTTKFGSLIYQVQTPDTSVWAIFYWNQTAYPTPTAAWHACTTPPSCTGNTGLFLTIGVDFNQARAPNFAADALIRLATLSAPTPNAFVNVLFDLPIYIAIAFLVFKFITAIIPTLNS